MPRMLCWEPRGRFSPKGDGREARGFPSVESLEKKKTVKMWREDQAARSERFVIEIENAKGVVTGKTPNGNPSKQEAATTQHKNRRSQSVKDKMAFGRV